ncbi:MAG: cupin domain-containing protein [Comamonadaceae bacterium]|nr:MAG: cupin domain-containing protein [Comamonadaceae bacterium]
MSQVMEYLAANKVFPVVCPPGLVGRNALAPLRGWPGLCITIAQCTPRQGPVAHNHTGTLETFFCLDGRFDVEWGNKLEHKVTLEPGDLCSVPPGVYRSFRNLTDREARLLVLIQGDETMSDKIEMPRGIGEDVRRQHGDRVMELLAGINMRFQGEDAKDISAEQMASRVSRVAQLQPQASGTGEAVLPIMAPRAGEAPVECWPGLSVAMLEARPGQPSSATVDSDHSQWVINLGDEACEVEAGGRSTVLNRYDLVRVEPDTTRTIRNQGTRPLRILLATQGRDTISRQAIQ